MLYGCPSEGLLWISEVISSRWKTICQRTAHAKDRRYPRAIYLTQSNDLKSCPERYTGHGLSIQRNPESYATGPYRDCVDLLGTGVPCWKIFKLRIQGAWCLPR